ncbi:MAG: NlpC/P60 family protein [Oscillospiraceae bacterium]|nr:NlpC/P60 family protein [Oscillospiraceae bacterium]
MSAAAGAKTALRIAGAIASADSDGNTLKNTLKGVMAFFTFLILLSAAVISILTSPASFTGALGDFQKDYLYILPDRDIDTGTGTPSFTKPVDSSEYSKYLDAVSDPERKALLETGFSLLGKVSYFWGGKSAAGWNDDWGKQRLVTSPGSKSTGTYRPYGLDCSGFADWCYKTAGIGDMLEKGGTAWQWGQSYAISADELQPGDLVFQNVGSSAENHVGLYVGTDDSGNRLYLHCSGSSGVTLNSYSGFRYFRRVPELDN